ncbi:MAG: methionyl-tRNA formyltransferase [Erysipelotrichales bacterium]|nr:methionyl-tRNA formyltransferase [Erysipelotrichales bacterium]
MKNLRVVFMGTPDFAVPVLKKLIECTNVVLVVSQPDAITGRKKVLTKSPVKVVAEENNIEVFTPEKLRNEYEYVINAKPDIIITCAYGQIVPASILDYPKFGCINVHASILPKYRGASPISEAIKNGEEKTGITIMYMDEGIDTGNIIASKEMPIEETDTLGTLSQKLSVLGAKTLIETLPNIIEGKNASIKQDEELATYVKMLKRSDERIDFNKTRKEVYNFIRSLNPAPSANAIINGEEWKILESRVGEEKNVEVGVITSVNKDSFAIGCKDGEILITRVKMAGKKEMLVRDLFNGYDKNKLLNQKAGD